MNWFALVLIFGALVIVAAGGAMLCHGYGHALRPKDRRHDGRLIRRWRRRSRAAETVSLAGCSRLHGSLDVLHAGRVAGSLQITDADGACLGVLPHELVHPGLREALRRWVGPGSVAGMIGGLGIAAVTEGDARELGEFLGMSSLSDLGCRPSNEVDVWLRNSSLLGGEADIESELTGVTAPGSSPAPAWRRAARWAEFSVVLAGVVALVLLTYRVAGEHQSAGSHAAGGWAGLTLMAGAVLVIAIELAMLDDLQVTISVIALAGAAGEVTGFVIGDRGHRLPPPASLLWGIGLGVAAGGGAALLVGCVAWARGWVDAHKTATAR